MPDPKRDLSEELNELEEASYSFRERLQMTLCGYTFLLYMALVLEIVLVAFAVLSALLTSPGPATRTILLVDFVLLGVAVLLTVGLLVLCNRG